MKIFLIYIFLYLLPRVCIGENIDFDKYNHQTCSYLNNKLSIFKKNDALFSSSYCIDDGEEIINNSILIGGKKYELRDFKKAEIISRRINLEAISIYKVNKNDPLLIILFSEEFCCYPQLEGKNYRIYLYKIYEDKKNNEFKFISSDHILGENVSGFDGISDKRMIFRLRNIEEIKKYLKMGLS